MEEHEEAIAVLKSVFNACDKNGDGFVKTQDLLQLGQEHSSAELEDIKSLVKNLDPESNGVITFEDFYRGVTEVLVQRHSDSSPPKTAVVVEEDLFPSPPLSTSTKHGDSECYEDNCQFEQDSAYSTSSTNGYNGDDDDTFHDYLHHSPSSFQRNNPQYSTYPPPHQYRKHKLLAPRMTLSRMVPGESSEYHSEEYHEDSLPEHHEGYGECSNGYEDHIPIQHNFSPLRVLPRRLSGNALANYLYNSRSACTSINSSLEDLHMDRPFSDSDANFATLSDKIENLSSQVNLLKEDQALHEDKQHRLKSINVSLVERVNALEEELEKQRHLTEGKVEQESQKYKQALTRLERENEQRLESLRSNLKAQEEEIKKFQDIEPMLKKELELAHEDKRRLQGKCDELESELRVKTESIIKLKEELNEAAQQLEEERKQHLQELAELHEQVEQTSKEKEEVQNRVDDALKSQQERSEFEQQLHHLREENEQLRSSREELRMQLLQHGHSYLEPRDSTIADELLYADKEEIVQALRDQERDNARLQAYLGDLLSMIMEYNPALLEKS